MGLAGYFINDSIPLRRRQLRNLSEKKESYTDEEYRLLGGYYNYIIDGIKKQVEQVFLEYNKPINGLCVSGGTHLALELNTWIYNNITTNIDFCPAVDDSGISLGLASYGYYRVTKKMVDSINTPFIQDYEEDFNYDSIGIDELSSNISKGKIYGIVRGKPECGPRALGHRSIIADPTKKEMYDNVSVKLKNREFYRPIAPIVTDRFFDELFIGPKGKYMQYKVICKDNVNKICPAITHKDNSSRPQVVYRDSDPWLYDLLVEFGKKSGVECLINTSLNKNAPICNTFSDAKNDFNGSDIQILNIKA